MLESLFIIMIIIGFLMTIYAHERESIIFSVASILFWLLIMANSLYIEVPFSTGDNTYMELGFNVLCLIFVFINAIQTVLYVMDWRTQKEFE